MRKPVLVTVLMCATLGLSACSGNPGASTSSPEGAVVGFIEGIRDDKPEDACKYVISSEGAQCAEALDLVDIEVTGDFKIGDVATEGDEAVVTMISDEFCINAGGEKDCFSNDDKSAGQPSGDRSFEDAFEEADSGSDTPVIAMIRRDGKWGVDFG